MENSPARSDFDVVASLLAPHRAAILADETGATAESVVESLLEQVTDAQADLLYEQWDALLFGECE